MPAPIPRNTELVITLCEAYNLNFSRQYNAAIIIVGSLCENSETIIWAKYKITFHFSSDFLIRKFLIQDKTRVL